MLVTTMILTLVFNSIKLKGTQITDDHLVQAFAICLVTAGISLCNALFGAGGINPATAAIYMMFEATQYQNPNAEYDYGTLNHYLWAYILGPIAGAFFGGILSIIHQVCAKKGGNASYDEVKAETDTGDRLH